jgi:hypothetical protein
MVAVDLLEAGPNSLAGRVLQPAFA